MRRFPHPGFEKRSAGTIPHVSKQGTTHMARNKKCRHRLQPRMHGGLRPPRDAGAPGLGHAHRRRAVTRDGKAQTPRSVALTMGMLYFLLRTDAEDLRALFFAEKSLNQIPFTPTRPAARCASAVGGDGVLRGMKIDPHSGLLTQATSPPIDGGEEARTSQARALPLRETSKPPRGSRFPSSPPSIGGEVARSAGPRRSGGRPR